MVQIVGGAGVVPVRVLQLAKGVQHFDLLECELYDDSGSVWTHYGRRLIHDVRCNCLLGIGDFYFYPVAAPVTSGFSMTSNTACASNCSLSFVDTGFARLSTNYTAIGRLEFVPQG